MSGKRDLASACIWAQPLVMLPGKLLDLSAIPTSTEMKRWRNPPHRAVSYSTWHLINVPWKLTDGNLSPCGHCSPATSGIMCSWDELAYLLESQSPELEIMSLDETMSLMNCFLCSCYFAFLTSQPHNTQRGGLVILPVRKPSWGRW